MAGDDFAGAHVVRGLSLLTNDERNLRLNDDGTLNIGSLVPTSYDEIDLSYTGANLTGVVYKKAAATVATLALTYSGSNLTKVTRS